MPLRGDAGKHPRLPGPTRPALPPGRAARGPAGCWPDLRSFAACRWGELAERAHVSKPTVVRFAAASAATAWPTSSAQAGRQRSTRACPSCTARSTTTTRPTTVVKVIDNAVQRAAATTATPPPTRPSSAPSPRWRGRPPSNGIEFYGVGNSGIVAQDAQHWFFRLGAARSPTVDGHVQVMSATMLKPGDRGGDRDHQLRAQQPRPWTPGDMARARAPPSSSSPPAARRWRTGARPQPPAGGRPSRGPRPLARWSQAAAPDGDRHPDHRAWRCAWGRDCARCSRTSKEPARKAKRYAPAVKPVRRRGSPNWPQQFPRPMRASRCQRLRRRRRPRGMRGRRPAPAALGGHQRPAATMPRCQRAAARGDHRPTPAVGPMHRAGVPQQASLRARRSASQVGSCHRRRRAPCSAAGGQVLLSRSAVDAAHRRAPARSWHGSCRPATNPPR